MTKKRESLVEIIVATGLIGSVFLGYVTAKDLIVNILLFIVFIELVRMVVTFLSEGKVMKIRYMIDGSIAFLLREMIIEITKVGHTVEHKALEVGLILVVLTFLFVYRYVSTKFSPKREDCE